MCGRPGLPIIRGFGLGRDLTSRNARFFFFFLLGLGTSFFAILAFLFRHKLPPPYNPQYCFSLSLDRKRLPNFDGFVKSQIFAFSGFPPARE